MSAIKRYIDDFIAKLADETGYKYTFLMDKFAYYCCQHEYMTAEMFEKAAKQKIFYCPE